MSRSKSIIYKYQDRYMCSICDNYEAQSRKGLNLHIKYTHNIEKPLETRKTLYVCNYCKKEFTKHINLLNHFKKTHQV